MTSNSPKPTSRFNDLDKRVSSIAISGEVVSLERNKRYSAHIGKYYNYYIIKVRVSPYYTYKKYKTNILITDLPKHKHLLDSISDIEEGDFVHCTGTLNVHNYKNKEGSYIAQVSIVPNTIQVWKTPPEIRSNTSKIISPKTKSPKANKKQ